MIEWIRTNEEISKGQIVEHLGLFCIVMDTTLVPNYDNKGRFLLMIHPCGEVTKVAEVKAG